MKIFVVGHPSEYGGAGSELYHQILLWVKMKMEVVIIPTMSGFRNEPLRNEMLNLGVGYTDVRDYSSVTEKDLVINFCSKEFLEDLEKINKRTSHTAFVNCMTWLFPKEKIAHEKGLIKYSLYQRPQVRDDHKKILKGGHNSKAEFIHFNPYFDSSKFPFVDRRYNDKFTIGRISRQDADKFSSYTFHIWEYAVAPKMKRGLVLGFDQRSAKKVGFVPDWVETYKDQKQLSVNEFYKQCDVIVQSTDTTENWPRVGFEAMYSGCPLIVDNKGGWKYMIKHKTSGFLCDNPRDFIYWTSRMAYEPDFRNKVAVDALYRAYNLSGFEKSKQSWEDFFNIVTNERESEVNIG